MTIEEIDELTNEEIENRVDVELSSCSGDLSFWQQVYLIRKKEKLNDELKDIFNKILKYVKWTAILLFAILATSIASLLFTIVK